MAFACYTRTVFRTLGGGGLVALTLLGGCASTPQYTKRIVEESAGRSQTTGAKRSTTYSARVAREHSTAHITVYESSVCDVIDFEIFNRIEQTYEGDELIESKNLGPRQQAAGATQTRPCDVRFARVPVELTYQGNTYPLGQTSPIGELHVDLVELIKPASRGVDVQDYGVGVLTVAGQQVGRLDMAGLADHENRVNELIAKLTALLGKDHRELSDAESTQAYMLHQQLLDIAPQDARVAGVHRRFLEVLTGREFEFKLDQLKRNLGAWNEARELVATLASSVPSYVVVDVRREEPTQASIAWAQGQWLHALQGNPGLCAALNAPGNLTGELKLAVTYLRYAYGDGYLLQFC